MECRIWSQPDARHWRPLCTNSFRKQGTANSCHVCATPYPYNNCAFCDGDAPYHYRIVEGEITGSGADLTFDDEATTYIPGPFGGGTDWYYRHHEFGWDTLKSFFSSAIIYPVPDDETDICQWGVRIISEIGYRTGTCIVGPGFFPSYGRHASIDNINIQPTYNTMLPAPTSKFLWPSGFGDMTGELFISGDTGESVLPAQPAVTATFQAIRSQCEFSLTAAFLDNEMTLTATPTFTSATRFEAIGPSAPSYCAAVGATADFSSVSSGYPSRSTPTVSAQWKSGELSGCLDLLRIPMEKVFGDSHWPDDIVLAKSTW